MKLKLSRVSNFWMFILVLISFFCLLIIALISFQNKVIFFPESLPAEYTYQFSGDFEEKYYETSDGVKINALHFKTEEPKGIVFYSHGNAGSLRTWGYIAEDFVRHNYDFLIYDYRGYGKSNGTINEENLYSDAYMIFDELKKQYGEDIIIYGRSIGTGIASKVATQHNAKLLILESPYYNLPDLARKIFPFIPKKAVRYQFRNDLHIQEANCPVAIFHGTEDEVVYFESSKKLEKYLGPEDHFIPVPGGHHNDLTEYEIYQDELKKLLQ